MWLITHDFIDKGTNNGLASCDFDENRKSSLACRFRLLDGDSEVYYEGLSDDCDTEAAFAPLDDFGIGHAGCAEIQYLRRGKWETL